MIHGHATIERILWLSNSISSNDEDRCCSSTSMLLNTRLWNDFSRRSSQTCSTGFSSGEYGGNFTRRIFSGTISDSELCQPAPSITITIRSSGYRNATSSRKICIQTVLTWGRISESSLPSTGETAAYA